jgi:hypothetical protein
MLCSNIAIALDKKHNGNLATVSLQESEENYTQLMDLTSQLVSTEIHEKCLHPSGETFLATLTLLGTACIRRFHPMQ